MKYRIELDGLRAIAVMSVILYHAGISQIGAGYAGVDVFFVISGFLIGGQIAKDLAKGTFTYWDFYARRVRRILPALLLVIICSATASSFIMVPQEFRYFGGGALSALLSVSNFWFWDIIDYFNPAAARDPLVHTWSLAVEEQFYLLVPLLFGLLWGFGKKVMLVCLLAITAVSFTIMVLINTESPMTAFYLLHTRAWELLAGVLAALVHGHMRYFKSIAPLLSNVGLVLTLTGLMLIPNGASWPGWWTLMPVTGTVLILLFGQEASLAQATLKLAPLRFIGLISYSAYLWHQPILSFLEITNTLPVSGIGQIGILIATLAISYLSWKFVEQPFRKQTLPIFFRRMALVSSACLIVVFSIGGHFTKGYPIRMSNDVIEVLAFSRSYSQSYRDCLNSRDEVENLNLSQSCVFGADASPEVAIWGDSHAAAISEPLGEALGTIGRSLKQFTLSSCQPIPSLLNQGQSQASQCADFNSRVLARLLVSPNIQTIVMFATWDNYFLHEATPNMFGVLEADGFYSYPISQSPNISDHSRQAAVASALEETLQKLAAAGKRVIIVASLPRPNVDIPVYFAGQVWKKKPLPENVGYPVEIFQLQTAAGRRILKQAVKVSNTWGSVAIVDPVEVFCNLTECALIMNRKLLYADGNHPSLAGITLLVPLIVEKIVNAE